MVPMSRLHRPGKRSRPHGGGKLKAAIQPWPRPCRRRHALPADATLRLLPRLRLNPALLVHRPSQVWGVELQRLSLLRALLLNPASLFADEATSRLDPLTQQEVVALLGECVAERGTAVLLVTPEIALAEKTAERVVRLPAFSEGKEIRPRALRRQA